MKIDHEYENALRESGFNLRTQEVVANWRRMEVSQTNDFVDVNRRRLDEIAAENALNIFETPSWRVDGVFPDDPVAFVSQQLVANAVNSMFNITEVPGGKYTANIDGRKHTGAFAMFARFYDAFGEREITTDDLEKTFRDFSSTQKFFNGERPDVFHKIPMGHERHVQLQDLIDGLVENDMNPADFLNLVTVFDSNRVPVGLRAYATAERNGLVDILSTAFPKAYGDDVEVLGEDLVFPFSKRVQLVPVVLHGRAKDEPNASARLLPFVDVAKIGPISDYQLPRGLREMGILEYKRGLGKRVDEWKKIPKFSQEEIEIRAATVAVCVELLTSMNALRSDAGIEILNLPQLDYWLWNSSRQLTGSYPHLTETTSY